MGAFLIKLKEIFVKTGLWIITILLIAIALPFFPSIGSVILILLALVVVPLKKVKDIRRRIFAREKKQEAPHSEINATFDPAGEFVNIGLWDIPAGEYLNTATRYERGLQIDPDRVGDVDKTNCEVRIMGSEGYAYKVSLAGCECMDYHRRGLPCKHMLRLAHDLGEEITLPVFDPRSNSDYNPQEDIAMLTKRWEAGQISTDTYRKCVKALQASIEQ